MAIRRAVDEAENLPPTTLARPVDVLDDEVDPHLGQNNGQRTPAVICIHTGSGMGGPQKRNHHQVAHVASSTSGLLLNGSAKNQLQLATLGALMIQFGPTKMGVGVPFLAEAAKQIQLILQVFRRGVGRKHVVCRTAARLAWSGTVSVADRPAS